MPKPLAHGRPGSMILSDFWSAQHVPVIERTLTACCTVSAAGQGKPTLDRTTGLSTPPARIQRFPKPVACRVQVENSQPATPETGDERVTLLNYQVVLTRGGDLIEIDDIVNITESCDDPSLIGRDLIVGGIIRGTTLWERILLCQDTVSDPTPTEAT